MKTILAYDGSFNGFLTGVFEIYEQKLIGAILQKERMASETFFDTIEPIHTNREKATRVWKGIKNRSSAAAQRNIYKVFLSELPESESLLLQYLDRIFKGCNNIEKDFSDPVALEVSKIAKKVDREKHRMDAFVRFRETKDGIYFALVAPDYNTLPLNAKHFKDRYADQQWMIYDSKRKYGLHYNLKEVAVVTMELPSTLVNVSGSEALCTSEEVQFQELWRDYFKSTNIISRKNMKLHTQHIPKRYWKYLSEKKPS